MIGTDGKPVTGGGSGTTEPVDPPEPDATAAPTVKGVTSQSYMSTPYYQVTFAGMESNNLTEYLKKITDVTVGTTNYTSTTFNLYNETNKYKRGVVDDSFGSSAFDCLNLTKDNGFASDADTIVTVKADGYTNLTFTVSKDGKLVTDSNAGGTEPGTGGDTDKKDAPTYTYKGKDGYYNAIRIEFGGDAETQTWLGKIKATCVKVNSVDVEQVNYMFNIKGSEFYLKSGENPSYMYIGNNLLTQEQNTVEITVDGYNTLTITVDKDGKEVE